jgi:hypothetical protein
LVALFISTALPVQKSDSLITMPSSRPPLHPEFPWVVLTLLQSTHECVSRMRTQQRGLMRRWQYGTSTSGEAFLKIVVAQLQENIRYNTWYSVLVVREPVLRHERDGCGARQLPPHCLEL